ncbi:MAG: PEP-CTERM sorting domain-containing protein [Phycisphaerae bacterium]|nr:PEP-CTERM sorting domain-containing protein [Phycisphaerae bacterium]
MAKIAMVVLLGLPTLCFAQSYDISLLGGGETRFRPQRIGPGGQIAGRANVGFGLQQAAVWDDGSVSILDAPSSWAFDLNSQGLAVGSLSLVGSGDQATVWTSARYSLGVSGWARAINENDVIVGMTWSPVNGHSMPTRWTPSGGDWVMESLSAGGHVGGAWDIAENGTIVGVASTSEWPYSPLPAVWANGNLTWLDTLGSDVGVALRVNEVGGSAGWVESPTLGYGFSRAFQWQNSAATDLGVFGTDESSAALAINNHGDVVGWSGEGYGAGDGTSIDQRATLWSNGAAMDLNSLIPPGSGWHLSVATDIDDNGRICGRGFYNGILNGFVLTPVPEPSTLLLVVTAIGLLRSRRRTRQW